MLALNYGIQSKQKMLLSFLCTGSDYKDISEQISLIGNQSTATISISITNDDLAEGLEMFGGLLEVASQTLNLSSVSTVRIEIIDDEGKYFSLFTVIVSVLWCLVEGICGNVLPRGNCSVDALCRVSKNGRKLQNCFCRDGFLGNGLMCQGIYRKLVIVDNYVVKLFRC